jgi:hypothetical protein
MRCSIYILLFFILSIFKGYSQCVGPNSESYTLNPLPPAGTRPTVPFPIYNGVINTTLPAIKNINHN